MTRLTLPTPETQREQHPSGSQHSLCHRGCRFAATAVRCEERGRHEESGG